MGLSVSRVGGNAQTKAMKQIAGRLRMDLAQYRELEAFTKFGSDLDKATLAQLRRGERMVEILKQGQYAPIPVERQIAIIYLAVNGFLDSVPVSQIVEIEKKYYDFLEANYPDILKDLVERKIIDDDLKERMDKANNEFMDGITTE